MHHCHATGCNVNIPPEMFMCKRHWFSLPKRFRAWIWDTYRPGQCDDWNISKEYSEAAKACVIYIANKEGRIPDIKLYEVLEPKNEV